MKKACIISIGNELLAGRMTDTNAAFLCGRLLDVGIPVSGCFVVPDSVDSIVAALKRANADANIVVSTGGLGPTDDDLTRQAFAEFLEVELEFSEDLLNKIQQFFDRRNTKLPAVASTQAYIPAGVCPVDNKLGTACGLEARKGHKLLFALPGVPAEMKAMFEGSVLPRLKAFAAGQTIVVRKLKCFGSGESTIVGMLGSAMQRGNNPLVNCTAEHGVITLHVVAAAKDPAGAEQKAAAAVDALSGKLGPLVYGSGDETLPQVVGRQLARQQKTVAVAESCTGGMVAKLITDVEGASRYFSYGWVTYGNLAKISELNVDEGLIKKYGAVGKEVAESMACRARLKAGTDYAIAITGIAGPAGGGREKPIGLVYISISAENGCETRRFTFSGDRNSVRSAAAYTALNMLRLRLAD